IKRLEGGRIPVWANSLVSNTDTGWKRTDGKYVVLTGDTTYPSFAISVTYKHTKTFDDGYTPAAPASQTEKLQKTIKKLKNGEDVNIVIYGDSISCGWSSSGLNPDIKIYDETNTEGNFKSYNINVAPYAPTWIQMFETELKNRYPKANINIKNLSLGGKSSPWAAENIEKRLALWKDTSGKQVTPDLMLIGFGVNDSAGNVSVQNFKTNIQNIISTARSVSGNSDMEALMYSPMYPNQDAVLWKATTLLGYEKVMEEIADADENAGLLKLSSIYNEIVKCKAPEDYLNTNLNHGNDFTARIYATGLLTAMSGESITEYLGTAIRAANGDKKQALRYKFSVSKDLINGNSDYGTLVEYGSIAIPSSYLEGAELIKDGKYKNSKGNIVSPVKGVTYSQGGNHTIFAEDNDNNKYIFTAALYNIGYNTTTKTTNYAAWGNDYSVRNYAIFEDNGNKKTVYDATIAVSSVFKVMDQIESAYEFYETNNYLPEGITDAKKLENDYKTVKSILGDANSEQSKAYQAWCNENVNYTPTCTVTADTTDGDAGYVVRVGRSYVAVPYTGNEFSGWYKANGTTLISTDTSLTMADISENYGGTVVAKFRDNNLLKDIAGAEELTKENFKMYQLKDTDFPEGNYFYCGADPGEKDPWQSASITTNTNYVHSGSKAISINARTQDTTCIVMRDLEPNTKYKMSFWWKGSTEDCQFETLLVAPMSVTTRQAAQNNKLGGIDGIVTKDPNSDWTYTEFEFTTGANDGANDISVKLFYYYSPPTCYNLYMDELTLNEVAKLYSVTADAENGVAYKSQLTDSVEGGTSVTFVCSPNNQDADFLGWYDGETKVSKQRTFTLKVNQDYNLTAKFTEGTKYADTKSGDDITTALQEEGYYDTLFERAIKNKGNQALIAKMLKKAQNGENITVVGLGGSITQGAGSTNPATNSYGQLFANLLQQTFNDNEYNSTVIYKNAGIGSTTSDLGLARMQAQVLDCHPDLVIVDFTTNDQNEERYRYTYEALIRKLMEEQVATIAIMFGSVVPENYNADQTCIKRPNRTDLHFPSLLYYDIPVIDYYGTMWDYLDSNSNGQSDSDDLAQWTKLWNDYIHPNDAGHKLAANAVHYYLNKVLKNIDSISTDPLPEVPQKLFYANTASYIGSTMYDNSNIDTKLKSSSNVTIVNYGNVDANTQSQWETWKISEDGYIEFTLPSCRSFTILRVQQPNGGKAKITINDQLFIQDNSYQSSGQLNWSSATYYGDGKTPTTILIECLGDGDNTKDTFYQISCVLFAE
ncbi:MAG: GDSL-type esterase/lipase family protein, partial [Acutalibacteraceae bacterium]|nr:GDSL-type esterase/lipase family protein [Acutalibacteraceae bacterium]